jgi:hypothetical protein
MAVTQQISAARAKVGVGLMNLRAALVLFHITAISVCAFPAPDGRGTAAALAEPAAQVELEAWSKRLGASPEAIATFALNVAERWDAVHAALVAPFLPYLLWTGTYQSWAVFIAPNRTPTRVYFEVHARTSAPGVFQTVFEEGSKVFTWQAKELSAERTRALFELGSWPRFSWLGQPVCSWAARKLFVERSDIDRVRCRAYRAPSPSPEQVLRNERIPGEWLFIAELLR